MRDDSYWSYREASPPELFGEPDDEDEAARYEGFAEDYEAAMRPVPTHWTCPTCQEDAPGCACDRRLLDDAMREAREGEG